MKKPNLEAWQKIRRQNAKANLQKLREHIKRGKAPKTQKAFNQATKGLGAYLTAMGWIWEPDFSGIKDPLTGNLYPTADLAFTVETERQNNFRLEETLKKQTRKTKKS